MTKKDVKDSLGARGMSAKRSLRTWKPALCVVRAVVSKRGVDDGKQKGGDFLQPAQESQYHYSKKK